MEYIYEIVSLVSKLEIMYICFIKILLILKVKIKLKHDEALRCVIIRAMGGRAFCTGADLKERATMTPAEVGPFVTRLRRMVRDFQDLPGWLSSDL